jgi:uncharacterized RDD family membrane protein YckC
MSMQPGWYPDPFSSGGYLRWWDGERWGTSTSLAGSAPADAEPGSAAAPMPAPPLTDLAGGAPFPVAPYGRRAVARIIDTVLESLIMLPFVVWLMWPALQRLVDSLPDSGTPSLDAIETFQREVIGFSLALTLISSVVTFAYEVPQNKRWGRTIGKRAMGLRIRPVAQDVPLTWTQVVVRWAVYAVGTGILGFFFTFADYAWPLWDKPLRQALHDKPARTVVVPRDGTPGW